MTRKATHGQVLKMKNIKTSILFFLTIFCTLTTFAESKLARIIDSDSCTNIHSNQSKDSPIVVTLDKSDFFYCELSNSEWLKIIALKWQNRKQVQGYIHKSKVQFIEKLDTDTKKELLKSILSKEKELAINFQNAWKSNDSIAYVKTVRELETYEDIKFTPILEILPKYFCDTKDTVILSLYFATMWADKGSANEIPSFAIGDCYICEPDLVLNQIKNIENAENCRFIFDHIEWGLKNHFSVGDDEKSDNKEYNKLRNKLDSRRIKACP